MSRDSKRVASMMRTVLRDPVARAAAIENSVRRDIAARVEAARKAKGLSIRGLAKRMQTSPSQIQRLLHREVGGSLTLTTLVRAADALGLDLILRLEWPNASVI